MKIWKLISRLVAIKALKFYGNRVVLLNTSMILIPIEVFVELHQELIDTTKNEKLINDIIYEVGKLQGYFGTALYIDKYKINIDYNDFSFYMEQARFVGLGNLSAENVDVSNIDILIENKDNPFAKEYKNKYNTNKVVDYFYSGLIAGAASEIFKKNILVKETKCLAKNDPKCEFRGELCETKSSIKGIEQIKEKYTYNNLCKFKLTKKYNKIEDFLKKKYKDLVKIDDTGFYFLDKKHVLFPWAVTIALYNLLENNSISKVDELYYKFGRNYGDFLIANYLKFSKDGRHINITDFCNYLSYYGLGDFEIKKTGTEIKIIHKNNPFLIEAGKFNMKNISNSFMLGVLYSSLSRLLKKNILLKEDGVKFRMNDRIYTSK